MLVAAGELVYKTGRTSVSARPYACSMRCVLYMLLAFSLRRRNLGRRNLRSGSNWPTAPQARVPKVHLLSAHLSRAYSLVTQPLKAIPISSYIYTAAPLCVVAAR
ncbi:MAG TPA: hypothetical protein VM409_06715 [Chloroflexia bacterium]|nr:hypothetical protein [Chloroflexia bacterium]